MTYQDDRTPEQKGTLSVIVLMTDSFMSGWGGAAGGPSYAGWACAPSDLPEVERWVRRRSDAKRVRIVAGDYRPKGGPGHCHIYTWTKADGTPVPRQG